MKKLGFGLMRLPLLDKSDEGSIDIERVKEMTDAFLARGYTYFDTAWMYHGFQSEKAAKAALVDRHPRDSYTLASKLHYAFFNTLEERDKVFRAQLEKTGAGYFDYYLLHDVNAESYKKYTDLDCFRWLREKKAQGLVKHMGFSFHDSAAVLDQVLTEHPEIEFVQLQINYLDWESPRVQSRLCHETAVRHGKKIVVMEPVKGGALAKLPPQAEKLLRERDPAASPAAWALRFAASLDNVMVVLSGMSDMAQMEANTALLDAPVPFGAEERALVLEAAGLIRESITVPCTGCSYCTGGCPQHLPIIRHLKEVAAYYE